MKTPLAARSRGARWRPLVAAVLLALGLCSCSSTSDPGGTPDLFRVQYDPRTHRFELQHSTVAVVSAGIDLLAGPAWTDAAGHVHVPVSLRNARAQPRFMPRGVQVDGFAPASVWPVNAGCRPPVPGDLSPQCIFWHFDSYGADHTLAPGASSSPVEWIFDDPGELPFQCTAWLWWPHG
jgi:hypothetical protein